MQLSVCSVQINYTPKTENRRGKYQCKKPLFSSEQLADH